MRSVRRGEAAYLELMREAKAQFDAEIAKNKEKGKAGRPAARRTVLPRHVLGQALCTMTAGPPLLPSPRVRGCRLPGRALAGRTKAAARRAVSVEER